jgi:mannose-6-phosphate isomerase-like protein (cupin superfamily)
MKERGTLASVVEYCIQPQEVEGALTALVTCAEFSQRVLRFDAAGDERRDDERDEVLYVLAGSARATIGGETLDLEPGSGVFVARGTAWRIEETAGLELLSVLVESPLEAGASHAVIVAGERGPATAGREFTLLARPEEGCASVTQFVGHIPPGRAPEHFHRYDEVVYILAGEGALHVDGESASLRPGTAIHLPARLVHCLENFGPGEMQVLGVFRPAGSPAEAYYPDGAAAVVPS